MELNEAKDILENVMADEVIGTYCVEIQKTTECAKNCEKEECFLQQAIDTVISELERLQKENEELRLFKNEVREIRKDYPNLDMDDCVNIAFELDYLLKEE